MKVSSCPRCNNPVIIQFDYGYDPGGNGWWTRCYHCHHLYSHLDDSYENACLMWNAWCRFDDIRLKLDDTLEAIRISGIATKQFPDSEILQLELDSLRFQKIKLERLMQEDIQILGQGRIDRFLLQSNSAEVIRVGSQSMKELQMSEATFINKSGLDFIDISTELYREYWLDGQLVLRIGHPRRLHVSRAGHRIFDSQGRSYYINLPKDKAWSIIWAVGDGQPNFVK